MRRFTADFETNVSETDCRVWAFALCEIDDINNFIVCNIKSKIFYRVFSFRYFVDKAYFLVVSEKGRRRYAQKIAEKSAEFIGVFLYAVRKVETEIAAA